METLDVAFVHPPASFEKRARPFAGVFPAETGTDSWFRHAPLGLATMAQRLRGAGFSARILNLAKALSEATIEGRPYDVEAALRALPARVYGVSLQWAVHTPGALALVGMLRRLHPGSVIVLGGLTASHFAEEALALAPGATGVLRGECESAIVSLAREARAGRLDPARVPNLVWRDAAGALRRNAFVAPDLSAVDWLDASVYCEGSEPDSLVIPILRGCIEDCTFCGGSRSAYGEFFERPSPAGTDPDIVLDHLRRGAAAGQPVAFLAGDLRGMGERRARRLLEALAADPLPIEIQNELYFAADRPWLELFARATRRAGARLSLSPESSDERVREKVSRGKAYPNETILETVRVCADLGLRLSLCFFFALPGQTRDSILRDLEFIDRAVSLAPETTAFMIEPMLFLDPGSRLYREPAAHGVVNRLDTLAKIRDGLTAPFWTEAIGYETRWLTREALVDTILDVFEGTNRLRLAHGHATLSQHLHVAAAVDGHRRVVAALRALGRPPTDEDVRPLVERHIPAASRGDNNLKDYNAHARLAARGEVPHAALPRTVEALIASGVPASEVAAELGAGRAADPATGDVSGEVGAALVRLARRARMALPERCILELARLEVAARRVREMRQALLGGAPAPASPAPAAALDPVAPLSFAPGAEVLALAYPVFDAGDAGLPAILSREGRYALVLTPLGTRALGGKAAALALAIHERPGASVLDLLPADHAPSDIEGARRVVADLARIGALRAGAAGLRG